MSEFARLDRFRPASINWLVPQFGHVYVGGVHTILSCANHFRTRHGVRNRIIVYNDPANDPEPYYRELTRALPDYPQEDVLVLPGGDPEAMPEADAVVATFWTSAYIALKFNRTRAKFFFVQDMESLFYPSGTVAALAAATYRLGLYGICNGPALREAYHTASGAPAIAVWPAVDHSIYYPLPPGEPKHRPGEPKQVVFYGRPGRPRNALELGLETLCRVKDRLGDSVRIVSAGSVWNPADYGVAEVVEVLGLLPSPESVAELYRHCDAGLVFMTTQHPSYQPLEYMACGCPTVTNRNSATRWLLRDGENCLLCDPVPSSVTEQLLAVLEDETLGRRLIEGGLRSVAGSSWERQWERAWRFVCKLPGLNRAGERALPRPAVA